MSHHHHALYRASELIREEEDRQRAWLHDTVLQVLEYVASGGYCERVDAERLMAVAARAADELRAVIDAEQGVPVPVHDVDFATMLREVVDEARELTSDTELRLDLDEVVEPVDPWVGAEIVDVVREALTNVRKHSSAASAVVQCIARNGIVEVRVVDDGEGFDPLSVREGVGMRCSMRQRMARCGGSVAIASAPGRGTVVSVLVGDVCETIPVGRIDGDAGTAAGTELYVASEGVA